MKSKTKAWHFLFKSQRQSRKCNQIQGQHNEKWYSLTIIDVDIVLEQINQSCNVIERRKTIKAKKKDWRSRKENIEHSVQFDFICSKWLDVMHGNCDACEDLALQKCSRTIILVILMDNYTKIHHVKNKVHKCYEWFAYLFIQFCFVNNAGYFNTWALKIVLNW